MMSLGHGHVSTVYSSMDHGTRDLEITIDRVKQDIVEKSSKDEAKKAKITRCKHKGMVVVPYVKGLSETFARILKSHGIATANHPHRTLRNFVVHPKATSRMKRRPN